MIGRKFVVAVVDDDWRLLESLEDLLESAGYAVRCFASAESLLSCGLSDFDLLVTDIGMPGIGGFELRERVMDLRPQTPVFLITGRHEVADQARAREAERLFRKPFDGQVLLRTIADALQARHGEGR